MATSSVDAKYQQKEAHREGTLYGYYGNVEFYNVSIVVERMRSTKKMKKIKPIFLTS